jgi:glycosyl transferase family 87
MSNPAIEIERGDRPIDRTRTLTIAVWSFAVWVAIFLVVSGVKNVSETRKELRLIPTLPYDERVDFAYFYAAADMVWNGDGDELYPKKFEYIYYPGDPAFHLTTDDYLKARLLARGNYYNPPLLAILESPLASMPFKNAFWLYSALSATAFVGFLALFWRSGRNIPELPLLILGLAAFRPVHEAVIMGHQSLFFVFAMMAGFLALRAKQSFLAGLLLSLLALKPQWAILPGLFLVVRGEWRAAAAMAIGSAALIFLPFIATGRDSFNHYVTFLRDQSSSDLVNAPHMFSWNGFLSKLQPNDPFAAPFPDVNKSLLYGLEGLTAAVVLFIWWGRDFYFGVVATIIGMLLMSTHSVWYDWAFLAVVAAFLVLRPAPPFVRGQALVFLLALFVSSSQSISAVFAPDGRHGFLHWSEPGFFSVTLVAAGTLVWIASRVVLEGQIKLPRRLAFGHPASVPAEVA